MTTPSLPSGVGSIIFALVVGFITGAYGGLSITTFRIANGASNNDGFHAHEVPSAIFVATLDGVFVGLFYLISLRLTVLVKARSKDRPERVFLYLIATKTVMAWTALSCALTLHGLESDADNSLSEYYDGQGSVMGKYQATYSLGYMTFVGQSINVLWLAMIWRTAARATSAFQVPQYRQRPAREQELEEPSEIHALLPSQQTQSESHTIDMTRRTKHDNHTEL